MKELISKITISIPEIKRFDSDDCDSTGKSLEFNENLFKLRST
jgi:hypothetical protein